MEAQVISLLRSRPLLTAGEAASALHVSETDVWPVFATVASTNAGAYTLLAGIIEEAARGNTATKLRMQKVNTIPTESKAAMYALMSLTYPTHVAASSAPIALRPNVDDTLRTYPVVSRAVMESRISDSSAPAIAPSSVVPPAVKVETVRRVFAGSPAAAPPTMKAELPMAKALPVLPVLTAVEVQLPVASVPPAAAARTTTAMPESLSTSEAPVTTSEPPRKLTVFDKMKEAAAAATTKRPRDGDDAPTKGKKSATAKPKKAAKTENTTSLAKLARASAKKKGVGAVTSGAAPAAAFSRSFLDEDDGDAMNRHSGSEESTRDEAPPAELEETPVLDVVEVCASNDDVIMCDDAPPLAFRPAEPVVLPNPPSAKKDGVASAKKGTATAATAESGAAQSTLSSFFNPAVVEFQKSYVREVQTQMKVENGEYICVDVPCYKHKTTGDVISEEEYHQQTAQLVRSRDSAAKSPSHPLSGAASDYPPSPAAKSASRNSSDKEEKTKSSAAPAKTLLSFFRPASKE
jgi:hypothetical protein